MDNHDIAHYGIAGALMGAVGLLGVGLYRVPTPPPSWPAMTDTEANAIVQAAKPLLGDQPLTVYCMDKDCVPAVVALRKAADAQKVPFHTERPIFLPNGLSIAADSIPKTIKLENAIVSASQGKLKVSEVVSNSAVLYIGFGAFQKD